MSNLLSDHDPRLQTLCAIGAGPKCCRWLARGKNGMFCAKHDPGIREAIERNMSKGIMVAQGDNCPGLKPTLAETR